MLPKRSRMSPESSPNVNLERRSVAELRADASKIVGYAVVFDTRSRDLGGFVEVVKPEAVSLSPMGDIDDVVALYNHDPGAVLGRTPQTLQLRKDRRGLAFTLDPANTQAGRDAFELVRRGDVKGASFGFLTKRDFWRKDGGTVIRELLEVEVREISLTAFPCYTATDVSVAQRSLQAAGLHGTGATSVAWLQLQARAR